MDDLFDRDRRDGRKSSIFGRVDDRVRNREWELNEVALRDIPTNRRFGLYRRGRR